jgi:type IV fimbrial biogenesis protein FimT
MELMVVVAIVGVRSGLALPSMRDLVTTNRMKSISLDLYGSLALARSEAIKRNSGSVSMIAAGGGWQDGWTVTCVDVAGSCGGGNVDLIAGDAVDIATITLAGPAGNIVTYNRDGRLATASGTFTITANNGGSPTRCVTVDPSGRPRTKTSPVCN